MSEYYWIVDAPKHRVASTIAFDAQYATLTEDQKVHVIRAYDVPPTIWVCDFCNEDIPYQDDDGGMMKVPCVGSYAICPECFVKHGTSLWDGAPDCECDGCKATIDV